MPLPFSQLLTWVLRSKWAQKYESGQDAYVYDHVARRFFGREKLAKHIASLFLEYLPVKPNQAIICERAAGTGIVTEALLAAGYTVHPSDISTAQLDHLVAQHPHVTVLKEDINDPLITTLANSVDGLTCIAADRFMTPIGQKLFASEAYRVLKPGGILIWPTFVGESIIGKMTFGWAWMSSSRQKIKLLEQNRFTILHIDIHYAGVSFPSLCRVIVAKKM